MAALARTVFAKAETSLSVHGPQGAAPTAPSYSGPDLGEPRGGGGLTKAPSC